VGETRACPMCAEEIQAEARVCQFCGTTFSVAQNGYCSGCHQIVTAGGGASCATCGTPLLDVHVETDVLQVPPLPAWAVATAAEADAGSATAAAADTIHVWQPLLVRIMVGAPLNALACLFLLIAAWMPDWAQRTGSLVVTTWVGPKLLPFVVLTLVMLLLWRGGSNQRPRGARRLTMRQWRQKWRQNRKDFGVRGAYRPVRWGKARIIVAALVWVAVAAVILANVQHLRSLAGVEIGAAPWVALASTPFGAVGCLLCMPVSRRRLVKIDSDGNYYGREGGS
jgi:hypothetical protein